MGDLESLILFIFLVNFKTTKNIKLRVNLEQISEKLCPVTVVDEIVLLSLFSWPNILMTEKRHSINA